VDPLEIKATKETPQINFDGANGVFSISGKSYPENVSNFYKPVFDYIELYRLSPKPRTTIEFRWLYYNTSTAKNIIKIIMLLKDLSKDFEIKWYCKMDFDLIIEKGKEIREVLGVNLNIIYT